MNILIYTKSNCPNCVSAKKLLQWKGLPYQEVDVEKGNTLEALVALHPEVRQMPAIFIGNQFVGGLTGLQAALEQLEGEV